MIYKNLRHYPTRMFAVVSQTKMSVVGIEYLAERQEPVNSRYLKADFVKLFPYLVWAPDEAEMAVSEPPASVKKIRKHT